MPSTHLHINHQNFNISYSICHLEQPRDLIVLHGWGSYKELMEKAFANQEHLKNYRLIFVDLPGFGKSSNEYVLDSEDYKMILEAFFEKERINKYIIVGHSFGGKIAALLNPKYLVLLSSAGIVPKKRWSVLFKIYLFKVLKLFGFGFLYHHFATKDVGFLHRNMYDTLKKVVDEDFKEIFSKVTSQTSIFWGEDDGDTPVKSGEIIASLIKGSTFEVLQGDHFFFLDEKNTSYISSKIADVCNG